MNVSIALVITIYGSVPKEDSESFFWTNRLDFITEVEVLSKAKAGSTCVHPFYNVLWRVPKTEKDEESLMKKKI